MVAPLFSITEDQLQLVFSGANLTSKKNKSVAEVGLEDNSILFVIMRLPGGMTF